MATTDHYPDGERPTPETLQRVLGETVEALEGAKVRYVLMGGVGAAAMARPRQTDDIDVFVAPGDAVAALDALEAAGFDTEEYDPTWLFKAFREGVLVDIVFRSSGDIYLDDEMLSRAQRAAYKGHEAWLISPEDLLVIKAVASGEHTAHHWYDALGIIARCDLDWGYVVRRAREAGPRRVVSLLLYAESTDLAVPAEAIETLFLTVHPAAGAPDASEVLAT